MTGFQPDRCAECGHPLGDHHVVKTGGLRPPAVGGCLLTSCDCTTYRKDPSHAPRSPDHHRSDPAGPDVAARPGGSRSLPLRQVSGDQFVDAVKDARAELAGDAVYLTTREAVSMSLNAPHGCRDLYPFLRDAARHPFGLPSPDRARPLGHQPPVTSTGATTPGNAVVVSLPATAAQGPDLPSAA